jgi:CRP-like cAMP-binding protein
MRLTAFNIGRLFSSLGYKKESVFFRKKQIIFSHGDRSDSIFYIEKGTVKLALTSANGKEAFIGLLDGGDFFGESCLTSDKPTRSHTATAVTDMQVLKIDRLPMIRVLFAYAFVTYLLRRNVETQEHLVNALVGSSDERLARVLRL